MSEKIKCNIEVKESEALQKTVASELNKEDKPLEDILKHERKEPNNTRTT